jgi:hypothetical protein
MADRQTDRPIQAEAKTSTHSETQINTQRHLQRPTETQIDIYTQTHRHT